MRSASFHLSSSVVQITKMRLSRQIELKTFFLDSWKTVNVRKREEDGMVGRAGGHLGAKGGAGHARPHLCGAQRHQSRTAPSAVHLPHAPFHPHLAHPVRFLSHINPLLPPPCYLFLYLLLLLLLVFVSLFIYF
jgi:hypothetical protein